MEFLQGTNLQILFLVRLYVGVWIVPVHRRHTPFPCKNQYHFYDTELHNGGKSKSKIDPKKFFVPKGHDSGFLTLELSSFIRIGLCLKDPLRV